MNDPFVAQQARFWAERMIAEVAEPPERIDRMFREILGRPVRPEELVRIEQFIDQQAAAYQLEPQAAVDDHQVWADVAHALFNIKEFIFIR